MSGFSVLGYGKRGDCNMHQLKFEYIEELLNEKKH